MIDIQNLPVERIEFEARQDGLKGRLKIVVRPCLVNYYEPLTGTLTIRPYKKVSRLAQVLAHEIKHQIDLEKYPLWLVYLLYWPAIVVVGIIVGQSYGIWWGLLSAIAIYFFHPYELSANIYSLRKWKKYLKIIEGLE